MQLYQKSESGRTAYWWLDEDIDLVDRLWNKEHKSAGQISKAFEAAGRPRSRNSVIGFINRKNWQRSPEARKESQRVQLALTTRTFNPKSYKATNEPKPVAAPPARAVTTVPRPAPTPQPVAIEPLRVSLLDLQRHQCRMPVNEAVTEFCGLPTEFKRDGRRGSYCPQHGQLARSK
jgi:hypothetical protein